MSLPEKQRIRAAFSRAAASYDGAAMLQRTVCDRLLATAAALPGDAPQRILDAGCGTGYGARLLSARWPTARLTIADFAETMLRMAHAAVPAVQGASVADIETLPYRDGAFDLWWSSLTVQWCDMRHALAEAERVLAPGGRVALSTLGPDTYRELRTAFGDIDRHRHTLDFSRPATLASDAVATGLADVRIVRETITLHYPDLKRLLGAIKAIGANALGDGRRSGMMGRTAWQALTAAYECQRTPAGLPASYDVIFLTAGKP